MFVQKTIPCLIVALGLCAPVWSAQTEITAELALHLKFDNDTKDASGGNLHGEPVNNPAFVEGVTGSHALECAGDGSRIAVEPSVALNFGAQTDFSVALWIKTGGWTDDAPILTNKAWKSGKNSGWGLFGTSEGARWKVNLGDSEKRVDENGGVINDNQWHQIAATFDRDGLATLYQDGARIGKTKIAEIGSLDTEFPTVIAQDGTQNYAHSFNSTFDDVAIWRRILDANEINDIYVAGLDGKDLATPKRRKASAPYPKRQSVGIAIDRALRWRGGLDAVAHDIYFGTNPEAVANATKGSKEYRTTLEFPLYRPEAMQMGTRYYWRIDTHEPDKKIIAGEVWAFTTKRKPVGQWVFNSNGIDGQTVKDLRGGADATVGGSARLTTNPDALVFDGRETSVRLPNSIGKELAPDALTAEAWVYVQKRSDPGKPRGIVGTSPRTGWRLGYNDARFEFTLKSQGGSCTLQSQTEYITERWYHLTATYDGSTARLYVDGNLESTNDRPSGAINVSLAPIEFGAGYLNGRLNEVRLYDRVLSKVEIERSFQAKEASFPKPSHPAFGPYLQFVTHDSAVIRWRTDTPTATLIEYGEGDFLKERIEDPTPKTEHSVTLNGLKSKVLYQYVIKTVQGDSVSLSPVYECDNFFNYSLPPVPDRPSPYPADALSEPYAKLAQRIINEAGVNRGHCLVLGAGRGRLAYELARQSDLHILGVETDESAVADARHALKQAGLYGPRVTVRLVESLSDLPLSPRFANLIVSERMIAEGGGVGTVNEVLRLLRPSGGVAYIGTLDETRLMRADITTWLGSETTPHTIEQVDGGLWLKMTRGVLPGSGEWSHQYGRPDNAANGGETLQGATATGELEVQWIGRPGPRAMVDRNPRKPAPLSLNGRLFTQGLHRLIAQDAYNGAILWSLEIPAAERFNMPRDCSNWCLDSEYLYAAIRDDCWRLNAQTGELVAVHDVVTEGGAADVEYNWGYIARSGDKLYGSATRRGASYDNFRGGSSEGWYDATTGPVTYKVCSDSLFAMDPATGETVWRYMDGVILNSTITIARGRVYFIECQDPKIMAGTSRRIGTPELWNDQFMVALDKKTGKVLWKRPLDTEDGTIVFYLLCTGQTLLIGSSSVSYHVYAFDAEDGAPKWHQEHKWISNNHGQHMQHPAIVGDTVYLRPQGYKIADGSLVTKNMPPHEGGCATFAGTSGALIYRGKSGNISMWDVKTEEVSFWTSIRPGCWLSTIPAGGMVLSPEGGGGCSCGGWLETSLGFARNVIESEAK